MSTGPGAVRGWRAVDLFQVVSYLQYPALLAALGHTVASVVAASGAATSGWAPVFAQWNYALLYMGIGIGVSSLQDPTRTQNAVSLRVWQDPRKGRWMLILLAGYAVVAMLGGLAGAYMAADTAVNQLSLGLVAVGLGLLGLLKTAMAMREHHRRDAAHAAAREASP